MNYSDSDWPQDETVIRFNGEALLAFNALKEAKCCFTCKFSEWRNSYTGICHGTIAGPINAHNFCSKYERRCS